MSLPPTDDTIVAIATAPGHGAIGVVRLSGPRCYPVGDAVFRSHRNQLPSEIGPGRATFGAVLEGAEVVDEAVLLTFRAPRSYTGQDSLEFQVHGGPAVLRKVLQVCLDQGARLAQAGEFTLRAFLSGRIDLVQAESVLDMVQAQSDIARKNAALGLGRALSNALGDIQSTITAVYGNLQAVFDYPDEGVPETEYQAPLRSTLERLDRLLATARAGVLSRHGVRLALMGRPNAGKSSLLNALLGYDRSLVSETPGTTRDYLEAPLTIGGFPITAIDTAGLRDTQDAVEASGVRLARDIARNADLRLYLIDRNAPLSQYDLDQMAGAELRPDLVVATKADLAAAWDHAALPVPAIAVSARTGAGLDALREQIRASLAGQAGGSELWITSERHAEALRAVRKLVERAMTVPDDLAALDLEEALRNLAEITGRGDIAEETLEHIFSHFCVGK